MDQLKRRGWQCKSAASIRIIRVTPGSVFMKTLLIEAPIVHLAYGGPRSFPSDDATRTHRLPNPARRKGEKTWSRLIALVPRFMI